MITNMKLNDNLYRTNHNFYRNLGWENINPIRTFRKYLKGYGSAGLQRMQRS